MRTRLKVLLVLGVISGLGLGFFATYRGQPTPNSDEEKLKVSPPSPVAEAPRVIPGLDAKGGVEPDNWEVLPPWEEHYHPFLADESTTHSVSVGDTSNGYLINGRLLPLPGLEYDILPRQRARGLSYGSDQLIALIVDTAKLYYKRHGRKLWVGNIGRRGGGDIPYSVSHNSGRDADLAFCYTDNNGIPVEPPDLIPLDDDGVSLDDGGWYHFDAARTWTVIKGLITSRKARIQYLFISNPLKRKLLNYARSRGESSRLIARADEVLLQPGGGAAPHNDHIHVRIFCSERDVMAGCMNTGRGVTEQLGFSASKSRRIREVRRVLKHKLPDQRLRAIDRLVLLKARGATNEISGLLADDAPEVRQRAAHALGRMGTAKEHVGGLSKAFDDEEEPEVQIAFLKALTQLGGARASRFIGQVIADGRYDRLEGGALPESIRIAYTTPEISPDHEQDGPWASPRMFESSGIPRFSGVTLPLADRTYSVRLAAIEAASRIERAEPVEALISVLGHHDPLLRGRAARALRRLTNQSFEVVWDSSSLSDGAMEKGYSAWESWFELYGKRSRRVWLIAGFRARGYQVTTLELEEVWELVRAIPGRDYISYNAQRALMRLLSHTPRSLEWSKGDACWHWTRWVDRRRRRFKLPSRPAVLSECLDR